jgi:hypothetical protein
MLACCAVSRNQGVPTSRPDLSPAGDITIVPFVLPSC